MLENPASGWRPQVSLATLSNLYLCLKCLPTIAYYYYSCRLHCGTVYDPVHLAYNPSYSAYFFSQISIFLSQKISQQCFSADL
jgi:hypothetical protein